ncbi:MAG: peptide-methionine (R)-S-oxide reductase MsrB [Bacteroidetes bacterium]|nr:peptide-methionine (R)-S-oxide reductase MsrB [Bacteroidota bacterium]
MKFILLIASSLFAMCSSNTQFVTDRRPLEDSTKTNKTVMTDTIQKTDEEWKKILTPEQYRVLREKGTERPFTGEYENNYEPGTYVCAACGQELFRSDTKFNAGCGWPSFYREAAKGHIIEKADLTLGMRRVEIICSKCSGHLGHVFDDGPQPTGLRYCVNSVSLKFIPDKK